jgi:uncharacterized lipoprotein NlpE involved in copper resistance
MLTIDQLIYDPATNEGAKVGAIIVDAAGHQLDVNVDGSINVSLGTVTDLDIRNLIFATDKVDVSGSTVTLDSASLAALENITVTVSNTVEITNDSGNAIPVSGEVSLSATTLAALESITVVANNLDIRDLTFALDKVDTSGSRIKATNSSIANSAVSVTTTAAALTPSPLTDRTTLIVQNLGSKEIFIGSSSVTAANGVKIAAGASAELNYNASVALFARTASGTADVRIIEAAY